jgi:hypothetical protein
LLKIAVDEVRTKGGKLTIMLRKYDPNTPRGPSLSVRTRPEDCHSWAEQVGFILLPPGEISLPLYHYGFEFERPAYGDQLVTGKRNDVLSHRGTAK